MGGVGSGRGGSGWFRVGRGGSGWVGGGRVGGVDHSTIRLNSAPLRLSRGLAELESLNMNVLEVSVAFIATFLYFFIANV